MKTWEKPVLVILARGKTDPILAVCKSQDPEGVGAAAINGTPAYYYGSCMVAPVMNSTIPCMSCQAIDAS